LHIFLVYDVEELDLGVWAYFEGAMISHSIVRNDAPVVFSKQ